MKAFIVSLLLLLLLPLPAYAARHALLIGINSYPNVTALEGPVNDAQALKKTLVSTYGFPQANIKVLLNSDATKKRILEAMSELLNSTKPGDFIFIYFSGHGTSALDTKAGLAMGETTGALIPYDFKLDKDSAERTLEALIIGSRDLKPVFSELDRDRKLLIAFDACFSGNTVRNIGKSKGVPKFVPLDLPRFTPAFKAKEKAPYPYKNIIYLSASDEHEQARDLRKGESAFDGEAHGAMTDALLRGLNGEADTNHDNIITYNELYQFTKKNVQEYGHTPQILFASEVENPVFELAGQTVLPPAKPDGIGAASGELRVRLEGRGPKAMTKRLQAIKGLKTTEAAYDILVSEDRDSEVAGGYNIFLPGGDLLSRLKGEDEVISVIGKYVRVRELITLKNPQQKFNVWLSAGAYEGKTVFFEKESIDFTIKSEAAASLLLLNIDAHGNLTILLPESGASDAHIAKGGTLKLKELGEVEPPFGVEFFKLFAFKQKVSGFGKYAGRTLSPESKDFTEFLDLIKSRKNWAETSQMLVTAKKRQE